MCFIVFILPVCVKFVKSHNDCTKSRVREIMDREHPLRSKLRQDFNSELGESMYQKRAPLSEGYFGSLKKNYKMQKSRTQTP